LEEVIQLTLDTHSLFKQIKLRYIVQLHVNKHHNRHTSQIIIRIVSYINNNI